MNQAATLNDWKEGLVDPESFESRFRNSVENDDQQNPAVVCFSSGKGGVGKTSLIINIAQALARLGKRVMIFDADLGLANVDVMLGLMPEYSLEHVISGEKTIREIVVYGPDNIMIIPAGSGAASMTSLGESEKLFLLNEFSRFDLPVDIMLVDSSAGISDNVVYFNMAAQHRVVVLTPEPTSITDAYALIKILSKRHSIKDFSLLINQVRGPKEAKMIYSQFTAVTDRFLGFLSLGYLGFIPKDKSLADSVRRQKTALDIQAHSCPNFEELARNILLLRQKNQMGGNIRFFWNHILGR